MRTYVPTGGGVIDEVNKFYEDSKMYADDKTIELIRQNAYNDDMNRFHEHKQLLTDKDVLDFGCGAGGFLHATKTIARSVAGIELEKRMRELLNSEKIDCYRDISKTNKNYDVVTMFHVLEHIPNPREFLTGVKKLMRQDAMLIIEVPNGNDALLTVYNCKAFADFTYWSCHLYLYNLKTLKMLAEQCGFTVIDEYCKQRYPISNHLWWLAKGEPRGHQKLPMFNVTELQEAYAKVLTDNGVADTVVIILKK